MPTPFKNSSRKVPGIVIIRILNYLKIIRQLEKADKTTASSEELSQRTNIGAHLIRRDLASFGKFGQPRIGYEVKRLKSYLLDIISEKKMCNLAIVGVGNLGSALLNYKGFKEEGLKFVAAFDRDGTKVGKICGDVLVEHIHNMKESIKKGRVDMGVIAVPADNAQEVADKFVESGVLSILNFAPAVISVPKKVTLRNVDLVIELKALQFFSRK